MRRQVVTIQLTEHIIAITGGGGFFHSKGTWGCAAHKGYTFSDF